MSSLLNALYGLVLGELGNIWKMLKYKHRGTFLRPVGPEQFGSKTMFIIPLSFDFIYALAYMLQFLDLYTKFFPSNN